jgi:hypothetical protein
MRKSNWPSREEWAKHTRTAYYDLMPEVFRSYMRDYMRKRRAKK